MEHLISSEPIKKISKILLLVLLLAYLTINAKATQCDNSFIRRVNTDRKIIALSFDDGPHPVNTPLILDFLDQNDINATFFVIGENVSLYPELLRREISEGNEIGNHTMTHPTSSAIGKAVLERELSLLEYEISNIDDNISINLFRPPCGNVSTDIIEAAGDFDYKIILWSVDTEDWKHTDADKIRKNIIENVKPGSIILFHDYISGKSHTLEALNAVVPSLKEMGYEFVTVGELLRITEAKE